MLDKNLIQKNFKKSLETYNNSAIVQKKMAKKLISLINQKNFGSILEIGSYTGFLTNEINSSFAFDSYLALDIIDSSSFIKKINPEIRFLNIDIEEFITEEKFDLIIANASLQWCRDFSETIKKLRGFLNKNGVLAVSIFSEDNLFEIKESFNIGLNYPSIEKTFSKSALIVKEKYTLKFNSSFEALRHLKLTGVNSIKNNFSIKELKEKMKVFEDRFHNKLTYSPLYIID